MGIGLDERVHSFSPGSERIAGSAIRTAQGAQELPILLLRSPRFRCNPGWHAVLIHVAHVTITSGSLRACPAQSPRIRRSRWAARPGPSHPSAYARAHHRGAHRRQLLRLARAASVGCGLSAPREPPRSLHQGDRRCDRLQLDERFTNRFFRRSCGCSPSQCRLGASSRTPLSASTAAPAGASSEPSTCECGDPHGSGVDLLDNFFARQRGTRPGRDGRPNRHCVFVTPRFGSPAQRHRTVPTTRRKRCRTRRGAHGDCVGDCAGVAVSVGGVRPPPSSEIGPRDPWKTFTAEVTIVAVYATGRPSPPGTMVPQSGTGGSGRNLVCAGSPRWWW